MSLKASFTKEVWKGLGLALFLNLVNFSISVCIFISSFGVCGPYGIRADIGWISMSFWGLTQWVYLGPMAFFAQRKGKTDFTRGLFGGACATMIANIGTYVFNDAIIFGYAWAMDGFIACFGLRK